MVMDLDLETLSKGGLVTALLGLIYFVGMRLVAAVDRIGQKVDDHTKADVAAQSEVREEIIGMRTMVETALGVDRKPAEVIERKSGPVRTPPTGLGVYGIAREKTRGG